MIREYLKQRNLYNTNVEHALDRITTDFAIFTDIYRFRLRDILQRVWNRIINRMDDETREEAIKRLYDELNDMNGMCSTGHMSRIVNVLSGLGLKTVTISWSAQICANIKARLNNEIKNIEDEDYKGDIIIAMCEENNEIYKKFISDCKDKIYNILRDEFLHVFDKDMDGMEILNEEKFKNIFEEYYN